LGASSAARAMYNCGHGTPALRRLETLYAES
jgi:hypothetical protein